MDKREDLKSWQLLVQAATEMRGQALAALFSEDDQRFEKNSLSACGILLDYSKNLINDQAKQGLLALAKDCDVVGWRQKMFAGEAINKTENRAVLHAALRGRGAEEIKFQQEVSKELDHIREFSDEIRSGVRQGYSGKSFSDVVCIGIGGSNLGPQMVTEALATPESGPLQLHYISSVDAVPLMNLLATLNPETTLFVVSSKTFTTAETLINAHSARGWFLATAPEAAVAKHFVAVTVALDLASDFGILAENCFQIWDWVGGRFSLWSSIGLPIALGAGFEQFSRLLDGARAMDVHFCKAPLEQNLPVMLALVGVWNATFLGLDSLAVLPYDQSLHRLPAYLQQAEMESNGKSVDWQGRAVNYPTCPILWGQTGINGQHAFYQLLHQGTHIVAIDFIASVNPMHQAPVHHENLLANCFAQSQALMRGVDAAAVKADLLAKGLSEQQADYLTPHKVHAGNRPSNCLLLDRLDAFHLGALVAMYEHKIFVQGVIWQVYSFDQWGVELGKMLARQVEPDIFVDKVIDRYDSSTNGLINYANTLKAQSAAKAD